MHTAVALELSAGQARAAELTRTQGSPTTLPPPPATQVGQGALSFQLEESFSGFRHKQADSDTHPESDPRWRGRRPRAGLTLQSPGPRRPAASCSSLHVRCRSPPEPEARHCCGLGRAAPAGPTEGSTARAMTRYFDTGIAAHCAPGGAEKDSDQLGWTQS